MKKAIITGSTGLVGTALARYLSSREVEVLCLGQQNIDLDGVTRHFGNGVSYLRISMQELVELPERTAKMGWSTNEPTVFFHLAWRGQERLTDGTFADQLINATYAAEAVRTAKHIGCTRFISAGTIEETYVEHFLQGAREVPHCSAQTDYALAKLAARDMCKMVAYLEKIDYIHTRLSVPLAPDLSRGTYIASTLKKIAMGETYDSPKNEQLFDIVLTDDIARAFYMIGQKGRNKADYFIGRSKPATLRQFFSQFEQIVQGVPFEPEAPVVDHQLGFFETRALREDTGFVATAGFHEVIQRVLRI